MNVIQIISLMNFDIVDIRVREKGIVDFAKAMLKSNKIQKDQNKIIIVKL